MRPARACQRQPALLRLASAAIRRALTLLRWRPRTGPTVRTSKGPAAQPAPQAAAAVAAAAAAVAAGASTHLPATAPVVPAAAAASASAAGAAAALATAAAAAAPAPPAAGAAAASLCLEPNRPTAGHQPVRLQRQQELCLRGPRTPQCRQAGRRAAAARLHPPLCRRPLRPRAPPVHLRRGRLHVACAAACLVCPAKHLQRQLPTRGQTSCHCLQTRLRSSSTDPRQHPRRWRAAQQLASQARGQPQGSAYPPTRVGLARAAAPPWSPGRPPTAGGPRRRAGQAKGATVAGAVTSPARCGRSPKGGGRAGARGARVP
mmetsp:Transcript_92991/g.294938  ORF Transcript_92991/g.294938 Transcript_92991/m.294938 type:complete len:318 (-) Transcript_92991:16-969(-)